MTVRRGTEGGVGFELDRVAAPNKRTSEPREDRATEEDRRSTSDQAYPSRLRTEEWAVPDGYLEVEIGVLKDPTFRQRHQNDRGLPAEWLHLVDGTRGRKRYAR